MASDDSMGGLGPPRPAGLLACGAGLVRNGFCRARLSVLVLHDDGKHEYAYGPAQGLPDAKVGNFPQALHDLKKDGWFVISMKDDWKRIFAFE